MPRPTVGSAARRSPKRARTLPFELRRSPIQGTGAFAVRLIRKGQRIIEYAGERISSEEADRRYDESRMRRHHTFLFTIDRKTVVDGASNGNEARFINHSCDPNCEAIIEDGRIWIYALRTIRPGEELVYDYQYQRSGDADEDAEREKFYRCRCGAPNCRGTILLPPRKPRPKTASKVAAKRGAKTAAKSRAKTATKRRVKTATKSR
ncbi:MAG: SET domain-containing protein-lysine N-methyltransferase, partial [Rhodospirillales bacterium]|nr:SET domain-containing protein-lysine N-methyltransferase [Rhodospirillales bacterium]